MAVADDIIKWAKTLPQWQQDALRRLVDHSELADSDIQELTLLAKASWQLAGGNALAGRMEPSRRRQVMVVWSAFAECPSEWFKSTSSDQPSLGGGFVERKLRSKNGEPRPTNTFVGEAMIGREGHRRLWDIPFEEGKGSLALGSPSRMTFERGSRTSPGFRCRSSIA